MRYLNEIVLYYLLKQREVIILIFYSSKLLDFSFCMLVYENNSLEQSTAHSSVAPCVHLLSTEQIFNR